MEDISRLRALAASISELRQVMFRLEDLRDRAVHELTVAGVRPGVIIEAGRLSRSGYYRALEAPKPPVAGEVPFEEWDEYHDQLTSFEAEFEELWEHALGEWHEAGEEGEPEDFFPLSKLVAEEHRRAA